MVSTRSERADGARETGTPPAAAMAPSRRRRDIQGLRAIAVLMVVTYHGGLAVPGGFTGVDVFFVISGFVITSMLSREMAAKGTLDFRAFYIRRLRRLSPPLALVIVATLAASVVIQSPFGGQQTSAGTGLATSFFVANMTIWHGGLGYFSTASVLNPFLHMWSLGVEEQFYLLFPLTLLLVWRLGVRRGWDGVRSARYLLAALSSVSFVLAVWLTFRGGRSGELAFYSLPARGWEFGVGAVLALSPLATVRGRRLGGIAAAGAVLALAASAWLVSSSDPFPGVAALLPVAGAGLVIASGGHHPPTLLTKVLSTSPLVAIGDLSYGWYLWHWPAVVFAKLLFPLTGWAPAAGAALSLVPAWLSNRYLEAPLRRRPRPRARQVAMLIAGSVALPAVLSAAVLGGARTAWHKPTLVSLQQSRVEVTLGRGTGCLAATTVARSLLQKCVWKTPGATGYVMLAGDSHADSLSSGTLVAARSLGYDLSATMGSSCSPTPLASQETDYVSNCASLYQWVMARATTGDKPRLVVLSDYDSARIRNLRASGDRNAQATWTRALDATLSRLEAARVPVLLVLDLPAMGTTLAEPCRYGVVLALDCGVDRSVSMLDSAPGRRAELAAASAHDNVTVLDLTDDFCTRTRCSPIVGGSLMYADNQHLDAAGSRYVSSQLTQAIRRAVLHNGS